MKKMTLDDLRKLRQQKKDELDKRDPDNKTIQVTVGMGTCGIAAGAKETLSAIMDELETLKIKAVLVRQTGCMGLCYAEPTVEVIVPGMPTVIYGKVDAAIGRKIVTDHLAAKRLLDNQICDKPAVDIVR
jgi:NADP-reducing hydrogenase subunit HndB